MSLSVATAPLPADRHGTDVSSARGGGVSAPSPFASGLEGLMSLEGTAVQFGILPVKLPRETCSVDAENLLRRLGRFPQTDNPWLPVATLGPCLIFAHHSPRSADMWGVPPFLAVKVAISQDQYEKIRKDLVMRLSATPLPRHNDLESVPAPHFEPGDLEGAFRWLLEHYPFEADRSERLGMLYAQAKDKAGLLDREAYNALMPSLGVALQYLTDGPLLLCFNPEEAAKQDRFPTPLLEKHNVYPLYCGDHKVYLLSAEKSNYNFEDEWLSQGKDPVDFIPVLADAALIRSLISRVGSKVAKAAGIEVEKSTLSLSDSAGLVVIEPDDMAQINPQNLNHSAEELIHWILYTAITSRASDLHLEKYYNVARFRARIDGKLRVIYTAPEEMTQRFVAILKNYSNMNQSRQEALDGRFALSIGRRRIDVRVAAVPCRNEMQKIIMRFLDKQDGMKELSQLNFSKRQSAIVKRVMSRDQGLILITGPTGSGKTTTLYALINSVNDEALNIHTIEDPIEYEIEGINQTQTDPTHGLTFATGLRALLRSDPDVILIGECRDKETASSAINASQTGHLVLTTLHANDSLRAVSRLLSMGVEPHLVSDSLAMSQAQRLVRRLCNYCKRPFIATPRIRELFARQGMPLEKENTTIFIASGCSECSGTGYTGRVALMEMTEINTELSDLIERQATQTELRHAATRTGFQTLYQEGLIHVLAGNTTLDEIQKVSYTAY
ncbi:MAG: type II/IV secretion system protein [Verrucomicrobiaceae bacterium]|nr:type II/IV secretion system protein [Verrucomicrobiaceae bacterium]